MRHGPTHDEGLEKPDLESVIQEDLMVGGDDICHEIRSGKLCFGFHIEAEDWAKHIDPVTCEFC
jgi:hypothetical protein